MKAMRKRIIVTALLFIAYDLFWLYDVPSIKIMFLLLAFQVPAFVAGWDIGGWQTLIGVAKGFDEEAEKDRQ